jgi:hypothetical protein
LRFSIFLYLTRVVFTTQLWKMLQCQKALKAFIEWRSFVNLWEFASNGHHQSTCDWNVTSNQIRQAIQWFFMKGNIWKTKKLLFFINKYQLPDSPFDLLSPSKHTLMQKNFNTFFWESSSFKNVTEINLLDLTLTIKY